MADCWPCYDGSTQRERLKNCVLYFRKGALLLNNTFALLAALLMGLSRLTGYFELLIIGRMLSGINAGKPDSNGDMLHFIYIKFILVTQIESKVRKSILQMLQITLLLSFISFSKGQFYLYSLSFHQSKMNK